MKEKMHYNIKLKYLLRTSFKQRILDRLLNSKGTFESRKQLLNSITELMSINSPGRFSSFPINVHIGATRAISHAFSGTYNVFRVRLMEGWILDQSTTRVLDQTALASPRLQLIFVWYIRVY